MILSTNITAILLAAGRSRRFGERDKLLETVNGLPLALHAAQRIAELAPARKCAVCHYADGPLAARLGEMGFEILVNDDPASGLSRSLALGIGAADRHGTKAALICLGDMPFIRLAHLQALAGRFNAGNAPLVASQRDGQPMPPALFGRSLYPELIALEGDRGARHLLRSAAIVPCPAGELTDIDRPEDLAASPDGL